MLTSKKANEIYHSAPKLRLKVSLSSSRYPCILLLKQLNVNVLQSVSRTTYKLLDRDDRGENAKIQFIVPLVLFATKTYAEMLEKRNIQMQMPLSSQQMYVRTLFTAR